MVTDTQTDTQADTQTHMQHTDPASPRTGLGKKLKIIRNVTDEEQKTENRETKIKRPLHSSY